MTESPETHNVVVAAPPAKSRARRADEPTGEVRLTMQDEQHDAAAGASFPDALEPRGQIRNAEAEYALEYPCRCPHCGVVVNAVRVVRLLRTKVNFTSTLPRRGRAITCPACNKVLSAELSGFV